MTDTLLAVLSAHIADMHWTDVVVVRDVVDDYLNAAINQRQATDLPGDGRNPRTSVARQHERGGPT